MSMTTAAAIRVQCRLEDDYPVEQLQPFADAADGVAMGYMNRKVYADQTTLDAATTQGVIDLTAAAAAYDVVMSSPASTQIACRAAQITYDRAELTFRRTMNGVILDGTLSAAMAMIGAHLFVNRTGTDVAGRAVGLPTGAKSLLDFYRLPSMP